MARSLSGLMNFQDLKMADQKRTTRCTARPRGRSDMWPSR